MEKKGKGWLVAILLCLGLGIMGYPTAAQYFNQRYASRVIDDYRQRLETTADADMEAALSAARDYNAVLSRGEEPEGYEELLDFGNGMMGYLDIDSLDIHLPIYHGTGEQVLERGIGHLPQTALPVGGAGSHSVLSGHTGLPGNRILTDLDALQIGDVFEISIAGQSIFYQVDQILVVEPSNTMPLAAEEGKDYCTLVTCTPYGINSHRLLVRGVRQEEEAVSAPEPEERSVPLRNGWIPVLLVGLMTVTVLGMIRIRRRAA